MVQRNSDQVIHFCLAGAKVSNDWNLIWQLKMGHVVTIVESEHIFNGNSILASADVLILDCNEKQESYSRFLQNLRKMKSDFPGLCIVLVNGGIDQKQIALAFKEGVHDYFSDPYDAILLMERIQYLIRNKKNNQTGWVDSHPESIN